MRDLSTHPLDVLQNTIRRILRGKRRATDHALKAITLAGPSGPSGEESGERNRARAAGGAYERNLVALRDLERELREALDRPRGEWDELFTGLRAKSKRLIQRLTPDFGLPPS
jgi:hypothetical protein